MKSLKFIRNVNSMGIFFLLISFIGICTSCTHGKVIAAGEERTVIIEHGSHRYKSRLPNIPPGYMPPPGKCRIWYPDRPPGQQPPPGECWELERNVPPGAWLIGG